jgi:NAD+ synthase (glutamine-hydrolysing)
MAPQKATKPRAFGSLYTHGFVRVAAAVPRVQIAEPQINTDRTLALARDAAEAHAALVVFPELGLSGYSIEDLFRQEAVTGAVLEGLERIVAESAELDPVIVVGAPLRAESGLFNTAVVIHRGRVLGVVPKTYLPEYREFYEKRHFRSARDLVADELRLLGDTVPFTPRIVFECSDLPGFALGVEICEDLWAPIPPSSYGALAGATVLANLSDSNITVGKADYRRLLCASHSARMLAASVFTSAGLGESTTDLAWDGQALIYENGERLAESERFSEHEQLLIADVNLDRLVSDRATTSSFGDSVHDHRRALARFRRVEFELGIAGAPAVPLRREIERFPYVPADPASRTERCEEVYSIQVQGLETRLRATEIERVVIGVSGGLDSTHALIVAARALDRLGLPRSNVLGYTMPGFATSQLTLTNARALMDALGISANELDIRPAATQMLRDLGHPAADGEPAYDITYENVQAGERTSHLFRLANHHRALVVGTGDLSELALGWSTYGVGDQMSHYNVNASVPKTLIQFLLRWRSIPPSTARTRARCSPRCSTPRSPPS